MRLAFALYKYFPYGGLARDFMRIANVCISHGHTVDVYVMEWHGDKIADYGVHVLPGKGWSNHAKVADFHRQLAQQLADNHYDGVIGFNKIPDIDVYYAADPCYIDRFAEVLSLSKLTSRYRFYAGVEKAVFAADSKTLCLMISDVQAALFKQHYDTPEQRLLMLPPGIDPNRRRPVNAQQRRTDFRRAEQINEDDLVVLMVGTGFKTKGVDRALTALAALPQPLQEKTCLMVVGEDDLVHYQRLAADKGIANQVRFLGGRADVPDFLLAADLLLHPARKDNTGTVILEALVAGLPVLVTDVCGYAKHVKQSQAGLLLASPFKQDELNQQLTMMLLSEDKEKWSANGLAYADQQDLYSMPEKATAAIEKRLGDDNHVV